MKAKIVKLNDKYYIRKFSLFWYEYLTHQSGSTFWWDDTYMANGKFHSIEEAEERWEDYKATEKKRKEASKAKVIKKLN